MPRLAPAVPAESHLLCETCGYDLVGLPDHANCPECGTAVARSSPDTRSPSRWEQRPTAANFWLDTYRIIVSPTRFFRSLTTRGGFGRASSFAARHAAMASLLLGAAAATHATLVFGLGGRFGRMPRGWLFALTALLLTVACYVSLRLVTRLAAKLTTWEGTYRGLRLPYPAMLRVLHFHAAHYLPVGLLALATTSGFYAGYTTGVLPPDSIVTYLYILCGEVVLAAAYLFNTYWRAMRATMYANA